MIEYYNQKKNEKMMEIDEEEEKLLEVRIIGRPKKGKSYFSHALLKPPKLNEYVKEKFPSSISTTTKVEEKNFKEIPAKVVDMGSQSVRIL